MVMKGSSNMSCEWCGCDQAAASDCKSEEYHISGG